MPKTETEVTLVHYFVYNKIYNIVMPNPVWMFSSTHFTTKDLCLQLSMTYKHKNIGRFSP